MGHVIVKVAELYVVHMMNVQQQQHHARLMPFQMGQEVAIGLIHVKCLMDHVIVKVAELYVVHMMNVQQQQQQRQQQQQKLLLLLTSMVIHVKV